jgi:hypothetical protein
MNTLRRCKFYYLKEISFGVKGELPGYACEKGYDISNDCNNFCLDFQQNQTRLAHKR